jgi:hypothetical protein
MVRMIRKQIYIKPEQEEALDRRSKELGISEAELIRQYIDDGTIRPSAAERATALKELLADMKERAKMRVPQTGRDWTRDELYEERFERYSR